MPPRQHNFVIIAHRGDSSAAPENTTPAFDLALAQGFRHFETDCQLSADGVPVVLHDETLGRVNDGSGPAAAATLQQLQQLDAGSWFGPQFAGTRIPTLQEVLVKYRGRVHLHLVSQQQCCQPAV
jgi:glycerophosphoryl diester phosphodiesterase